MMTEKVQPGIYGNTKYLSLSQRLLLHQNLHMNGFVPQVLEIWCEKMKQKQRLPPKG
jgi:hypothetical protein